MRFMPTLWNAIFSDEQIHRRDVKLSHILVSSLSFIPDVAFLLVRILNGDDWDAGHILSVDQFGIIIPGKDVGTLPTTSGSFHLVELKMTFLRMTDFIAVEPT